MRRQKLISQGDNINILNLKYSEIISQNKLLEPVTVGTSQYNISIISNIVTTQLNDGITQYFFGLSTYKNSKVTYIGLLDE